MYDVKSPENCWWGRLYLTDAYLVLCTLASKCAGDTKSTATFCDFDASVDESLAYHGNPGRHNQQQQNNVFDICYSQIHADIVDEALVTEVRGGSKRRGWRGRGMVLASSPIQKSTPRGTPKRCKMVVYCKNSS